jgi:SynChlorMet cassette protein ScmD
VKVVSDSNKPIANPSVVLREEFDDWAILFDPDSGNAFGLNPVGVFIWKNFDGQHSLEDILLKVKENCENTPEEAKDHLRDFTQDLVERGFVGFEAQGVSQI